MDYQSSSFLTDGSASFEFADLPYQQKVNILQLIALERLVDNLGKLADLPTSTQLNTNISVAEQQLAEAQQQTAQLQTALNEQQAAFDKKLLKLEQDQEIVTQELQELGYAKMKLEEEQAKLQAESAKQQKLVDLLKQIDTLTDEALG
jgi:septal ring factor EnvC (AmiA/AmiB activator)